MSKGLSDLIFNAAQPLIRNVGIRATDYNSALIKVAARGVQNVHIAPQHLTTAPAGNLTRICLKQNVKSESLIYCQTACLAVYDDDGRKKGNFIFLHEPAGGVTNPARAETLLRPSRKTLL